MLGNGDGHENGGVSWQAMSSSEPPKEGRYVIECDTTIVTFRQPRTLEDPLTEPALRKMALQLSELEKILSALSGGGTITWSGRIARMATYYRLRKA